MCAENLWKWPHHYRFYAFMVWILLSHIAQAKSQLFSQDKKVILSCNLRNDKLHRHESKVNFHQVKVCSREPKMIMRDLRAWNHVSLSKSLFSNPGNCLISFCSARLVEEGRARSISSSNDVASKPHRIQTTSYLNLLHWHPNELALKQFGTDLQRFAYNDHDHN